MRTISILNFKGGTGKSSVAINLADTLSRQGKHVLVVDCDRQRNASSLLSPEHLQDCLTLREVLMGQAQLSKAIQEARPNLCVLPAHRSLEEATTFITVSGPRTLKLLKSSINQLEYFDFVLFDHSPSYSKITDVALLASAEMLIPVTLEPFAIEGLLDMINKLGETLRELEHEVTITGIIPNNLNFARMMTRMYLVHLQDTFGKRVTPAIRTDAQISKSQSLHQTVFEYDPRSKGVEDFSNLADFLLHPKEEQA